MPEKVEGRIRWWIGEEIWHADVIEVKENDQRRENIKVCWNQKVISYICNDNRDYENANIIAIFSIKRYKKRWVCFPIFFVNY